MNTVIQDAVDTIESFDPQARWYEYLADCQNNDLQADMSDFLVWCEEKERQIHEYTR